MITRLRQNDLVLLVALLLVVTLLALPVLTYPLGRDQGEFATIGRGLLAGRVPYRDLWNPKPPAVFYIYAGTMALFGQSSTALRLLDILMVPFVAAALFWLGCAFANRRVGLWVALLFPVFYFTETFWTLTQNDGLVLLPMVLAVVCMVKAAHGANQLKVEKEVGSRIAPTDLRQRVSRLFWACLSGALCGWIVWFKYPFALLGVVVALGYILLTPLPPADVSRFARLRDEFKTRLGVGLAFMLGGILVLAGGALYLLAIGAWDSFLESARVTAGYTSLTFNWDDFRDLMTTALGFRWSQWGLLFVLAALWFVLRRWDNLTSQPSFHTTERGGRAWAFVLLWALAALVMMLAQAKGYDYHWLPLLPPLALLAADSLDRLLQRLNRQLPEQLRLPLTLAAVLGLLAILAAGIWPKFWPYLMGQEDQLAYYHHFQGGEFIADESLQVVNFLRERVAPGDSLFIWGFRPEVYYLSGLNPATRFIFQFPLVADWYPAAWRQETVDTLWAALPPYVLVLQADYMPWVTGRHEDSHTLLQAYTELNNWLIYNYERETQIGNFLIWRRKPK